MKKSKQSLGVAIIGLGRIHPRHLRDSIKQIDELELRAVADSVKKKAKEVGERENVPYFTDWRKILEMPEIDVVAVTTPNGLHLEMGKAIAQANKHCVMEKPVALNTSQSEELVQAFAESKGDLFPVLQVRFNPAVQVVKQALADNKLGKILNAALIIRWTRPQKYFDDNDWRGTLEMDGGSLLSQAIHYIDIMQYLLGSVDNLYGQTATMAHDIPSEDMAHALVNFKSGAKATVEFTINTYPHNLECSLSILGTEGTIKIGGQAMNEIELWEVKNTPQPTVEPGVRPNVYAGGMYTGSCPNHQMIYQNLVNTVLYNKESFIKAEEALPSIRIIDAIKESSQLGKKVKVKQ